MPLRLALIQMKVSGGCAQENLDRAVANIAEAARHGAQVVLLPETMDLGWTDLSSQALAQPIPQGVPCRTLARAAVAHGLYVCAGLTEADRGRVYNAAVLLGPDGQLLAHHRKINELSIARPFYAPGDRLAVAHTQLGCIGLLICADAAAPGQVLARALGHMGAQVILSPCAWAVEPDHDNAREPYGDTWRGAYGPVARDFSLWFAGASNVGSMTSGPWSGHRCIGCSLVVGPDGHPRLQGAYGQDAQDILYVDIPVDIPASAQAPR